MGCLHGGSRLPDLSNCQLHALEKLQQRTLPRTAPYVHTAFMHDVLDRLCCNFGNMTDEGRVTASLPSLVYYNMQGCLHGHNSRLASASLGLLHVAVCSHATCNYLILLHNFFPSLAARTPECTFILSMFCRMPKSYCTACTGRALSACKMFLEPQTMPLPVLCTPGGLRSTPRLTSWHLSCTRLR